MQCAHTRTPRREPIRSSKPEYDLSFFSCELELSIILKCLQVFSVPWDYDEFFNWLERASCVNRMPKKYFMITKIQNVIP